jgi:hypothetical protein
MAPKPKKSTNKPYKPNIYEQYENRRSFLIDTVETPADRKNLKKDLAKAKSDYVIAKKDKQSRAAGTGYKPAPMSAAAKKKAAAAGKATGVKTKPKSTVSKVAKAAMAPVNAIGKVSKALAKQPRTKQMYRQFGTIKPMPKATKKK